MTEELSLRAQAARGVVWSVAERWLARLLGLVLLVVLARLLGPQEFGLVAAAAVVVDLVGLFVAAGVGAFLVQADRSDERLRGTALTVAAASGVVLAASLAALAPLLAGVLADDALVPLIQVLSVSLVFNSVVSVPRALLLRDLAFRKVFVCTSSATVGSGLLAVSLALTGAGAWSLVAQTVSLSFLQSVTVWVASGWRPRWHFHRPDARALVRFSLDMIGITVLGFARNRGETFVIATLRDPVTLGIWVVARRLTSVLVELFTQVVTRVAVPVFAKAKSDVSRLERGYLVAVTTAAVLCSPILFVTAALAPTAVPLIFGTSWTAAGPLLAVLALGFVPVVTSYLNRGLFVSLGRTGLELRFMVFQASSHLAVTLVVLLLDGSLFQLAVALAVRDALTWPLRLWTVRRVIPLRTRLLVVRLLRVWTAAGVAGAVAWAVADVLSIRGLEWVALVAGTCAGLATYLPVLWLLYREGVRELFGMVRSVLRRRDANATAP